MRNDDEDEYKSLIGMVMMKRMNMSRLIII